MPAELHRLEARKGLLDERGIPSDDAERAQSERLEVRAGPKLLTGFLLDSLPIVEGGQGVKP